MQYAYAVCGSSARSRFAPLRNIQPACPGQSTSGTGSTNVTLTFWGPSCPNTLCGVGGSSSSATGDWSKASVQAKAPAGTTSVRIEFRLEGAGTLRGG